MFPLGLLLAFNLQHKLLWMLPLFLIIMLCASGRYYLPLPEDSGRTGADLERSREFLIDLEGNRKLCHFLEERFADNPIVVKWPFVQMLSVAEFGYVGSAERGKSSLFPVI